MDLLWNLLIKINLSLNSVDLIKNISMKLKAKANTHRNSECKSICEREWNWGIIKFTLIVSWRQQFTNFKEKEQLNQFFSRSIFKVISHSFSALKKCLATIFKFAWEGGSFCHFITLCNFWAFCFLYKPFLISCARFFTYHHATPYATHTNTHTHCSPRL